MDNRGFAITGILYSILILFLVILALFIFSLQSKKTILDRLKSNTMDEIEGVVRKKTLIDASEVAITIDGEDIENVEEALDDLYEKLS